MIVNEDGTVAGKGIPRVNGPRYKYSIDSLIFICQYKDADIYRASNDLARWSQLINKYLYYHPRLGGFNYWYDTIAEAQSHIDTRQIQYGR